jgi:hypothetical protein
MPLLIASLIGGLVSVASSLVGRVLIALGIGYVSYQGIDTALTAFKAYFSSGASALPSALLGMLGVFKIGTGVNIVTSAILTRLTLNGLTSGAIKKMVVK